VPPTASTVEDYDYDSDYGSVIFNKRSADRPAGAAGGDRGCDCSSIQVYVYFLIGQRLRFSIAEQLNSPSWRTVDLTAIAEAEFLGGIQTKVFRVFLLAIHIHIYSFLRFIFLQTPATSNSFYCSVTVHYKGKRRKPQPPFYSLRNP
jgi:hypothetical protein